MLMHLMTSGREKEADIIIRNYPEEHYRTIFNRKNGFYVRVEEPGYPAPFWSKHGPKLFLLMSGIL